jgi:hypothetical protein
MYDPEKSDSGIIAMKPMNKAGRPVAEPVEPRPETKRAAASTYARHRGADGRLAAPICSQQRASRNWLIGRALKKELIVKS